MSHPSISTSEADPPFEEPPVSPDTDPTLDLEPDAEETLDLASAAKTLVGSELQKGKYRVLALRPFGAQAGTAATGASYTALHTDLQKRLTLRYLPLDPQASAEERDQTTMQFLREVRVLAKLDHPSLPRVHDYFCEGAACYVVMDELSERTLVDVLTEAAQAGRFPALPPARVAQLGLELLRALDYLHQQRPPLVLGGLRAEDIALPVDGPAQLVSLSALSMVASPSSGSLPGFASLPTLPEGTPARPPEPDDDLYSLGLLLRELVGGAEVVAHVLDRLRHPDEALQADGADDVPPISLVLAGVIQIAAHDEPGRRFQSAAAFETALKRAWMVERRIMRQAEGDERAPHLEPGEDDLMTTLDLEPLETRLEQGLATRSFWTAGAQATICWRCGGQNAPGALLCRVCGARQPVLDDGSERAYPPASRRARSLPRHTLDEAAWAEWGEDETADLPPRDLPVRPRRSRPPSARTAQAGARTSAPLRRATAPPQPVPAASGGRRLLWGLVWACFLMAFLLGSATVVVTYLALR